MKLVSCKKCKFKNIEGSLICYECGAVIDKNEIVPEDEFEENIFKLPAGGKDLLAPPSFIPVLSLKDKMFLWIGNNLLIFILMVFLIIAFLIKYLLGAE